jgi:hypothetical protein
VNPHLPCWKMHDLGSYSTPCSDVYRCVAIWELNEKHDSINRQKWIQTSTYIGTNGYTDSQRVIKCPISIWSTRGGTSRRTIWRCSKSRLKWCICQPTNYWTLGTADWLVNSRSENVWNIILTLKLKQLEARTTEGKKA